MKSVVDLFVAKDRTAVFWFTLACASILTSAIYVRKIIADVSTKPIYVIMDSNGTYYYAPSVEIDSATPLHEAQTRLAMETIYNRKPRNLVFEDRVRTLFYSKGIEQVKEEFNKDAKKFTEEDREQTIEVTGIKVLQASSSGGALTEATGTITRHSTYKGHGKVEVFTVKGKFVWRLNKAMGINGLPPTVCVNMKLGDPVKQGDEG